MNLMQDITKTGFGNEKHTTTKECKCPKCASQYKEEIVPQRKMLCPTDKMFREEWNL